jgi:hypothetical protein
MRKNILILMLIRLLLLALLVLLKSIDIQVAHWRAAHQCQTAIKGSAPNLGMTQQTMASMYGQGYTHTAPSFTIPNPSSTPYTSRFNGRAYPNPSSNFQAPYTTVAYIDPIPLPGSSLGFLPNHAYQILPCFNAYG